MRNAEAALRHSKHASERIEFYEPAMSAHMAAALAIETRLRRACERNEFVLHYQPKLSLTSGQLIGAEALDSLAGSRSWVGGAGASSSPRREDTGMIIEVGRWVAAGMPIFAHGQHAVSACRALRLMSGAAVETQGFRRQHD
ncbi:MAG: EAL domain-containing protein [Haliea sp.]|nr:EAL domain-containing protein [Haliea sp.]